MSTTTLASFITINFATGIYLLVFSCIALIFFLVLLYIIFN